MFKVSFLSMKIALFIGTIHNIINIRKSKDFNLKKSNFLRVNSKHIESYD